jgi:hypothetical protein
MSVAQIVTGSVNMSANFGQTDTIIGPQTINGIISQALQYVNNTGVNYGVDQMFAKTGSLASTTVSFHFETSTVNDPFGNTLAMLRIRELIIANTTVTLGSFLKVYATASDGITWLPGVASYLSVPPGGVLRISDPLSFGSGVGNVIGATTDGLELDSGSNTVSYQILVLGCSVA